MVVAKAVPIDDTTDFVATLRSRDSAAIMPQVEGQVTRIFVQSGDRVARGTPLVQIDPAKQQATVRSQQDTRSARDASLAVARQQYQRTSALDAEGIASQAGPGPGEGRPRSRRGRAAGVGSQVRERAGGAALLPRERPDLGIVGDIPVRVGDRVTDSTLLTTVAPCGGLEAYVSVPVERAAQLRRACPCASWTRTGAAWPRAA
jgi:multidrug efflux pump subunit AcrA (membrane-fusion protein)